MRKVIAGINMTLDGYCDHTAVNADDELHVHFSNLLKSADTVLYGRVTYQLMEYWKDIVANPTGNKPSDDFAVTMDQISKVVFSRTLKELDWKSARLAQMELGDEVKFLRQLPGKNILVGSRSLITALIDMDLLDELQLTIHPVIMGAGRPLFNLKADRKEIKLIKTSAFSSGAVTLYYQFG